MLFARFLSSFLLLGVRSVLAIADDAVVSIQVQDQHKSITLEPGKEYSRAELQALFDAQASGRPARRHVEKNLVTKQSSAAKQSLFRRLAPPSPLLTARRTITLKSVCPLEVQDDIEFIAQATYNGINVIWQGHQNIDGWGLITIGGGRHGKPLDSRAEFYHSGCRAVSPGVVCNYTYRGVLLATVHRTGENKGVDISLITPSDSHLSRRPFVNEFCRNAPTTGTISCVGFGTNPGLSGLSGLTPVPCQYLDSSVTP